MRIRTPSFERAHAVESSVVATWQMSKKVKRRFESHTSTHSSVLWSLALGSERLCRGSCPVRLCYQLPQLGRASSGSWTSRETPSPGARMLSLWRSPMGNSTAPLMPSIVRQMDRKIAHESEEQRHHLCIEWRANGTYNIQCLWRAREIDGSSSFAFAL